MVDFAIKLPGDENGAPVWLPIDAKFPIEDYHRLIAAQESSRSGRDRRGDEKPGNAVEEECEGHLHEIHQPAADDGFRAHVSAHRGTLCGSDPAGRTGEQVQRECKVIFAGPTTLAALLNSLQMGFRTLAIQKSSSEVWSLLATVRRRSSGNSAACLRGEEEARKASNQIDDVVRSRGRSKSV